MRGLNLLSMEQLRGSEVFDHLMNKLNCHRIFARSFRIVMCFLLIIVCIIPRINHYRSIITPLNRNGVNFCVSPGVQLWIDLIINYSGIERFQFKLFPTLLQLFQSIRIRRNDFDNRFEVRQSVFQPSESIICTGSAIV